MSDTQTKMTAEERDRMNATTMMQIPVRMTGAERAALRTIASEERRTMQVVIMQALRDAYPDRFPQ